MQRQDPASPSPAAPQELAVYLAFQLGREYQQLWADLDLDHFISLEHLPYAKERGAQFSVGDFRWEKLASQKIYTSQDEQKRRRINEIGDQLRDLQTVAAGGVPAAIPGGGAGGADAISFVEKEPRPANDFTDDVLVPVFMTREGREAFLMNRRMARDGGTSPEGARCEGLLEAAKDSAIRSNGAFVLFYGGAPHPLAQIEAAGDGGFYDPEGLLLHCPPGEETGSGCWDMQGSGPNIAPFHFRIYDQRLAEQVMEALYKLEQQEEEAKWNKDMTGK